MRWNAEVKQQVDFSIGDTEVASKFSRQLVVRPAWASERERVSARGRPGRMGLTTW